jgi:sulfoquinovose isomerase
VTWIRLPRASSGEEHAVTQRPQARHELGTPEHAAWAGARAEDLLRFYVASADFQRGGFGALDDDGHLLEGGGTRPAYLTSRMTYCYALGSLLGFDGAAALAEHGLAALRTVFRDDAFGGWYAELTPGGTPADDSKATYAHAFVVLASATATTAGLDARDLLDDALAVVDAHLWEGAPGLAVDLWDREWRTLEDYRGMNANMHLLEALLAAHEATGDAQVLDRAASIGRRLVAFAGANDWRVPEHFTGAWEPRPDYNTDRRGDQFRPYGATPGHGLEWARLLVLLDKATGSVDSVLLAAAVALFGRAIADGWDPEQHGIAYTTDWTGMPVVTARLHWPLAEAIGAARYLELATGDQLYARRYADFWRLADTDYIDHDRGGWHHELSPEGRPASTVWGGKPDQYHALQATLMPRVSRVVGLAETLRGGATSPPRS